MPLARGIAVLSGIAALGLASLTAFPARADLSSEAKEVRGGLEADRALVAAPAPLFLEAGGVVFLEPSKLLPSGDACVTLVVLGGRTTHFTLVHGEADEAV